MPKQKGNNLQKAGTAAAQTDDEFDDMLAELRAVDLASLPACTTSPSTTTTSSSSSSSSSGSSNSTLAARATTSRTKARERVPEATNVRACVEGDVPLMPQWVKGGVRVTSAEPLCRAAANGKLVVMRILVDEMGADVSLFYHGY
jgi:hypothetical protein